MGLTLNTGATTTQAAPPPANNNTKPTSGDDNKFPALPDGYIHEALLKRCEIRDAPYWEDYAQEVSFGFAIDGGEYNNRWLWGAVEARLDASDDCELRRWLENIIGQPLPDGFEFEPTEFNESDLDCKIQVRRYYSKKYDEFKNQVSAVLPSTAFENAASASEAFG